MERGAATSTVDPARRRGAAEFVRTLIGEARRRARRRRSRYAGAAALSVAVLVGIVVATQQGSPGLPSSSPAAGVPTQSAIQVHPTSPNIVYAGALGDDSHEGGVYKSTDGGETWSLADTGLINPSSPTDSQDLRVDALALDPRFPDVLYAGTGLGVFKTTDGAKTWKLASTGIELPSGVFHRMLEGFIYEIAIDPVHTSTVYATGYNRVVWRSTDGGGTWRRATR